METRGLVDLWICGDSWRLVERASRRVGLVLTHLVQTHLVLTLLDLEAVGNTVRDVGVQPEVGQQGRKVVVVGSGDR